MNITIKVEGPMVILTWIGRKPVLIFGLDGADNFQGKLKKAAVEALASKGIELPAAGKVTVRHKDDKVAMVFEEPCDRLVMPGDAAMRLWGAFYEAYKRVDFQTHRAANEETGNLLLQELHRLEERYKAPVDRALLARTLGVVHSAIVGIPTVRGGLVA